MNQKSRFSTKQMVIIGLMAALVFIFSKFRIDIPSPLGKTGIHFGNIICLLAGMLFGAVPGGLAAGIGSALLDLSDPTFAPEFWITFLTKFAMGYVAGYLNFHITRFEKGKVWLAGGLGSATYVLLYGIKNILMGHWVKGFPWEAAILETLTLKIPVSALNGVIAVICAVILYQLLFPSLSKAGLLKSSSYAVL